MSMTVKNPESRLIFLISTPRAGSTLLMRILNATDAIAARSEPHLIPPLAHLGYWSIVEKAPYDQLQAQDALQSLLAQPGFGNELYLEACRGYTDTLYTAMIAQGNSKYFLDKTNSLVFLLKLPESLMDKENFYKTDKNKTGGGITQEQRENLVRKFFKVAITPIDGNNRVLIREKLQLLDDLHEQINA